MTNLLLIRVNCPDRATADAISEALIQAELTPCTNLFGPVSSTYVWQGKTERAEEWVLHIKAQALAWTQIEAKVKALHPHETPAILALSVVHANMDYAQWVVDNSEV